MAHAVLFEVCYMKQKHKLIKVCSSVLCKCVIASFFCSQVEVCCEHAITFVPKIIWRATYGTIYDSAQLNQNT